MKHARKPMIVAAQPKIRKDPGLKTYPETPHHDEVVAGFRVMSVAEVAKGLGLPTADLAKRIGVSRSTFHRKQKHNARLTAHESDALARHSTLLSKATTVFNNDRDAAKQWLGCPQIGLGGAVPLDLARTTFGYREVEKLLTRINYGVYA